MATRNQYLLGFDGPPPAHRDTTSSQQHPLETPTPARKTTCNNPERVRERVLMRRHEALSLTLERDTHTSMRHRILARTRATHTCGLPKIMQQHRLAGGEGESSSSSPSQHNPLLAPARRKDLRSKNTRKPKPKAGGVF